MNQSLSNFVFVLLIQHFRNFVSDKIKSEDIAKYINQNWFDSEQYKRDKIIGKQFPGWSPRNETNGVGDRDSTWIRNKLRSIINDFRSVRIVASDDDKRGMTVTRRDGLIALITLDETIQRGKKTDNFRSIVEYLPANLSSNDFFGDEGGKSKPEISRVPGNMITGGGHIVTFGNAVSQQSVVP